MSLSQRRHAETAIDDHYLEWAEYVQPMTELEYYLWADGEIEITDIDDDIQTINLN